MKTSSSNVPQPLLGLAASAITITLSLGLCALFDVLPFLTWVAFVTTCAIPAQMVMGLVWNNAYPTCLKDMAQPWKGLANLGLLTLASAIISPLVLMVTNGGISMPTPFAIMYAVLTVVSSLWVVVVFQTWPIGGIGRPPLAVGLGVMAMAYLLAWLVFRFAFDYSAMSAAPYYSLSLDPQGAFPAWNALSFTVTTAFTIMMLALLDFWPVSALAAKHPSLQRQPIFGLTAGLLVLAVSGAIWWGFAILLGMDKVDYLVRVPVSGIFGTVVMLVLFQTAPFQTAQQPRKGLLLIGCGIVVAVIMYYLYAFAAGLIAGSLPKGPPGHVLELWLATAMLSVTFPLMIAYCQGFEFWPLIRRKE
ncbi:MAG: hypothetical protein HQL44_16190 [Alphaproteobacteria bacterium]|nr:hypothetical protein [Alphaproteobacteria bacterium]